MTRSRLRWLFVALVLTVAAVQVQAPLDAAAEIGTGGQPVETGHPFADTRWFIDPNSPARQQAMTWRATRPDDAALMDRIASQPTAEWFDGTRGNVYQEVNRRVSTITDARALPVLVAYNIPLRDCQSGGAESADGYRTWIRELARGIGDRKAVVILEPDALANLPCLDPHEQQTRLDLINDATAVLKGKPNVAVYIDAGHANWMPADRMASLLTQAGIERAQGFALNVAGFGTTADNVAYGQELSSLIGGKHFLVDTSRNGKGPTTDADWCNPPGRGLGRRPTANTDFKLVDAFLWVKEPGISDGTCNGGPAAGTWWPEYALGLAERDEVHADRVKGVESILPRFLPAHLQLTEPGQPTSTAAPARAYLEHLRALVSGTVLLISFVLALQAFITLGFMLYTWARTDRVLVSGSPDTFEPPTIQFTALLPARHEREVIASTMQRVWNARYPKEMLEVVVVCEHGDIETIAEAERAARLIGHPNARVITFDDGPINKPHGLNVALRETRYEVVTIFDAEDDVHPDIFNVANTIMLRDGAGILQAGVQLMDFRSTWFAIHNVLEYFFWFKSRLHFHAHVGMVPLGGNTVFMRRDLIELVGGWDEQCLTEDADIGIRLSTLGERITISYDADHATREETPPSIEQFIKQRTRWNQGFLQILRKGVWKQFPRRSQRALAAYTLTYPFVQSFFGLLWIPALIATFTLKLELAVAMISLLPLYALGFQFFVCLLGLFSFTAAYGQRVRPRDVATFTLSFLPYQVLLSIGALRAVYRYHRGTTNWEKTAHTGAHRTPQLTPAPRAGD